MTMFRTRYETLRGITIFSAMCILANCTSSILYGPPDDSLPTTIEAIPDTAAAYLATELANSSTVSTYEEGSFKKRFSETRLRTDPVRLGWYLAYVAERDELPVEPRYSTMAAQALAQGYACKDYSKSVTRDKVFIGPGEMLFGFVSLATSSTPRVVRSSCKPDSFVTEYNTIGEYTKVPIVSEKDLVSAAEAAGFTCGVNMPDECQTDFSTLITSFNGDQVRQIMVRRGSVSIELASGDLPRIRFDDDSEIVFDANQAEQAEKYWQSDILSAD